MSRVRTRFVRSIGVAALAAVVVYSGGPAYAGDGPTFGGTPDGPSSATIGGSETTTQTTPGTSGNTGSTGSTGSSNQWTNWQGSTSSYPGWEPSSANACDPGQYGPQGYSPTLMLPAPCVQPQPGEPAEPGQPPAPPVITTQMVVDAATVTAPTNPPHVEPGTVSYVNIPNNYWTESNTVTNAVNVLGQTIPLTWTPTGTTWSFGDGGTASGDGVEGAAMGAPGAIEHAYGRQGSYDITTTTTYDLSFVLPGQGAQTIPLTSPPSPPVTLPIREIQTLVSFIR